MQDEAKESYNKIEEIQRKVSMKSNTLEKYKHLFKKDTNSKFTNGSLVSIIEKLSEDIDTLKNTHKHELSVKENDKKEILAKTEKYVKQIDGLKESVKNIKAKFRAQLNFSMKNINNRLNSLDKQIETIIKLVNCKPKNGFSESKTTTTPLSHQIGRAHV